MSPCKPPLQPLSNDLANLKIWMNFLKLNSNKSEIIITGPKSLLPPSWHHPVSQPLHQTTRQKHHQNVLLPPPQRFMSSSHLLPHAVIVSRLDLCNSILYSHPSSCPVAHPLYCCPVAHYLHKLPIQYQIQFKTMLITCKALNKLTPSYLTDLLTVTPPLDTSDHQMPTF